MSFGLSIFSYTWCGFRLFNYRYLYYHIFIICPNMPKVTLNWDVAWYLTSQLLFDVAFLLCVNHLVFRRMILVIRHDTKTRTHGYPPKPTPILRVFPTLTMYEYGFRFSMISKHGYGMGYRDIGTPLRTHIQTSLYFYYIL